MKKIQTKIIKIGSKDNIGVMLNIWFWLLLDAEVGVTSMRRMIVENLSFLETV